MSIFVCGINHQTAPIELREKIVFAQDALDQHLQCLLARGIVQEAVILSTCNRTEIYAVAFDVHAIYRWLLESHGVDPEALQLSLYAYQGTEAITHLMRVACGLDSMVLGESQILGQVKSAFAVAVTASSVGPYLERLFPRVFAVAKKVRTHTSVGACPVSLASMAVKFAKQCVTDLSQCRVLVIGAGETGALAAKHFYEEGVRDLIIASRRLEKAELLTRQLAGSALEISDIFNVISTVDIVISATSSSLPIIYKETLERRFAGRSVFSLLMIDIAVPRDIEPTVAEIPGVTLCSIDDLQETIAQHVSDRKHAAHKAEEMIVKHAEDFIHWQDSLEAASVISAYRLHVERLRDEELDKSLKELKQGFAPEIALKNLARNLSNKFMHTPSVNLKKAGYDGRFDLIELMQKLYDVESS